MPIIAGLVLEFFKKYWKYIALAMALLAFFLYMSVVFKHANEYKEEKKEVVSQQKTISNLSITLQKQKDFMVDVENNSNKLEQENISVNAESSSQNKTFKKNLDNDQQKVNDDFNNLFGRFNK